MFKKRLLQINIIILFFLFTWWMLNNNNINEYLTTLRTNSVTVTKKSDELLYREIIAKASQYELPPENAKIDRVWKAIPGYNGLTVDINASYEKMRQDKLFSEQKLVFKQVQPSIKLQDLPPAPVYRGNPNKNMVSFAINVAWGNEYLSSMLSTLKKHNVKATFFLEGRWTKENPSLAKMIVEAGHEVGNHSYTHPDFKKISVNKMDEEIAKTNEVIKVTTGENCRWFAPPSGSFRDETVTVAAKHKLRTTMWTIDTIDWQKPSVALLLERVISKLHPGAIILMHPTDPTDQALDQLITKIKAEKYEISTLSNLLSENRHDD